MYQETSVNIVGNFSSVSSNLTKWYLSWRENIKINFFSGLTPHCEGSKLTFKIIRKTEDQLSLLVQQLIPLLYSLLSKKNKLGFNNCSAVHLFRYKYVSIPTRYWKVVEKFFLDQQLFPYKYINNKIFEKLLKTLFSSSPNNLFEECKKL